ncbi:MAG: hypothetical protein J5590_05045 [Clostridia bacterium]|nr:hypothetical protein [Clostridia bacterium]
MKVLGFVGVSGSGKSYRALDVAAARGIKYIIDDGLLISQKRVIAGKSAKKESTRLASVRCALFFDKELAESVKEAIKTEDPDGIMILGTSHEMVEKIAKALDLPNIEDFIEIEDVASAKEINTAKKVRQSQGKHVIPVPTFEIKKDFSGYWMDALKKITRGKQDPKNFDDMSERTVVRPTFSYLGEFQISNSVLTQICLHEAEQIDGITKALGCHIIPSDGGIDIRIDVAVLYGLVIKPVALRVIDAICKAVDFSTSINVNKVTVTVKTLTFQGESK